MAGIGFEIYKILDRKTLLSYFKCFSYGVIISSGPWMVTVLTLSLLYVFTKSYLTIEQISFFIVTILYVFCFSSILTGPFQIILSRYISDQLFLEKKEKIASSVATLLLFVAILSLIISFSFLLPLKTSIRIEHFLFYKLFSVVLFVSLSGVWLIMNFITCLRRYWVIFIIFLAGSIVCLSGALLFKKDFNITGILGGYVLGILLIFFLLLWLLIKEFPFFFRFNKEALRYFPRFVPIALTGLSYNAGMWSDKILNWFLVGEKVAGSNFYVFPSYDIPTFLAYLTMIPGLAYFLIGIETAIMNKYSDFLASIREKPFILIRKNKETLIRELRFSFKSLAKFQGIVSLVVFIFAGAILQFLRLNFVSVVLFRVLLCAVYFQTLLFITVIFLLYFEFRRDALIVTLIFLMTNLVLSWFGIRLGENYYGWGYLLSSFISSIVGIYLLFIKVKDIDFHIFSSQPIFKSNLKE